MERKQKVIIWGYPLYSHTHSYIHEAFYKTFKFLGFPTYWFHDSDYPIDFDFNNCIFITEGFADKNIPINTSSIYFVMYPPQPEKYRNAKAFYEMRLIAKNFKDHISEYDFKQEFCEKISENFFVSKNKERKMVTENLSQNQSEFSWKSIYFNWATNLLPYEFDFSSKYLPRKKSINFIGTIAKLGETENLSNMKPLMKRAKKLGIKFNHFNPWKSPVSTEHARKLIEESIVAPDVRGKKHVAQGLVTCRVFKNISYGHLGLTNSIAIYNAMEGNLIYEENSVALLDRGLGNRFNYNLIDKGMKYCMEKHTYLNRCQDLLKLV